jgi:hypothetical protein
MRTNRTATVRRILAQQPDATPKQIAKQMGRHVKPWEVRDIMSAIAAKDTITAPAAAAPPAPPPTKSTPSGAAWVHPIRRRALGLPVAPDGYAIGS